MSGEYFYKEATLDDVVNNPHLDWDYVYLAQNPRLTQEWLDRIPQLTDKWSFISYNKGPGVQNKEFLTTHKDRLDWYAFSYTVTDLELVKQTIDLPWDKIALINNYHFTASEREDVMALEIQVTPWSELKEWKIDMLRKHGIHLSEAEIYWHVENQFDDLCGSPNLNLELVLAYPEKPWNFRRLTRNPEVTMAWILQHFPGNLMNGMSSTRYFDMRYLSETLPLEYILEHSDLSWCWEAVCRFRPVKASFILDHPEIPWHYRSLNENKHFCVAHALTHKEPVWKWDLKVLVEKHSGPDCFVCSELNRSI